ncbi:hypothetical protein [Chishuiella sp.]|uniref:hypothetical protein n=1 Tax=Chishuiella sp. TaxID=1969467 RepID=UPI0028A58E1B|nr:hypothetical protein [Chishuiella sp.]
MEIAKGIIIPVIADFVLSPHILYNEELTGIYFETEDEQYGRITFEKLDALKICRGENLPYISHSDEEQEYPWVYKVENSKWLKERFDYENKNYGSSYEFGGNASEMLADFSHYLFQFHDQFVEVIARGFWFEKDKTNLFKKKLQEEHPLLNLNENNLEKFTAYNLTCQIRRNLKPINQLVSDAKFCSQKLLQFAIELDGNTFIDNSLILSYKKEKLVSTLTGYFGKQIVEFCGIAKFDDVKPYIENYMFEVYERRMKIER